MERIFARPGVRRRGGSDYEQLPETEEARICRPMSPLRPRSPMANDKSHHHMFLVASPEEAEQRIRDHYLDAVTILTGQDPPWTKRKESRMPLYMGIHRNVEGSTSEATSDAHRKNLEVQDKHGARCLHYWYNQNRATVFCLFEAPSTEATDAVHREASGLPPTR